MNYTIMDVISLLMNAANFALSILIICRDENQKREDPPDTNGVYQGKNSSDTVEVYDSGLPNIPAKSTIPEGDLEKSPSPPQQEPPKE